MTECPKIAVAMSVYKSDKLDFLKLATASILEQSYQNFHLFIEVDGPVSSDVEEYLLSILLHDKVSVNFNLENKGLAHRLNCIIKKAITFNEFEFLARMDADDISEVNRFENQIAFFFSNPDLSILGSDVVEIDKQGRILFYKKMIPDNKTLVKKVIKKCPFNHPTVMFKMDVFTIHNLKYQDQLMNTQDYYLWVDAIHKNLKLANINKPLLKFRLDENFHKRRGLNKSLNEFYSRLYAMKKLGIFTFSNITHSLMLLCLRLSPSFVKDYAYNKFR